MSVLDFKGKKAGAGPWCIYQLITGQVFYSETATVDGDGYYLFDGDQTLVIIVNTTGNGRADIQMMKVSGSEFAPKKIRIPQSSVLMVQDCGREELVKKAQEALSGLVLPGAVH